MASERDEVMEGVTESQPAEPPKLEEAITTAQHLAEQTKQLQLTHQHKMEMKKADLGLFGRLFGAESQASISIAFVVVVCGLLTAAGLWWIAYATTNREFWSGEAHIALGAVTTALGYVFGRGSKDSYK
jgi:hypothetical protein